MAASRWACFRRSSRVLALWFSGGARASYRGSGRSAPAPGRSLAKVAVKPKATQGEVREHVEVLADPGPYKPRTDGRRRSRLLREHARRIGDPTTGGSTRQPIMTAYRQQALACAARLRNGEARLRDLRHAVPDAGPILQRNVYGWFERTTRGVYRLTPFGEQALVRWAPDMTA